MYIYIYMHIYIYIYIDRLYIYMYIYIYQRYFQGILAMTIFQAGIYFYLLSYFSDSLEATKVPSIKKKSFAVTKLPENASANPEHTKH